MPVVYLLGLLTALCRRIKLLLSIRSILRPLFGSEQKIYAHPTRHVPDSTEFQALCSRARLPWQTMIRVATDTPDRHIINRFKSDARTRFFLF